MRTRNNFFKKDVRAGFTLVEVLVVLAITSLLAGMVLTYSSKGRAQVALYVESAKIAQLILKSKSLAIATYNQPAGVIPCGYGVHMDYTAESFELFSYKPAFVRCSDVPNGAISASDITVLEHYVFESNVIYNTGVPNGAEFILFMPPDPQTLIWTQGSSLPSAGNMVIPLTSSVDRASLVQIRISSAGQVSFP